MKELRNYGDEVAREMLMQASKGGALPSSQRRDFEEFMRLVSGRDPGDSLEHFAL